MRVKYNMYLDTLIFFIYIYSFDKYNRLPIGNSRLIDSFHQGPKSVPNKVAPTRYTGK